MNKNLEILKENKNNILEPKPHCKGKYFYWTKILYFIWYLKNVKNYDVLNVI